MNGIRLQEAEFQGHVRSAAIATAALCWLLSLLSAVATAADISVTNTNDSGGGSLRQAVISVGDGEDVIFEPVMSGKTINLSSNLAVQRSMNFVNDSEGTVMVNLGSNTATIADGSTIALDADLTFQASGSSDIKVFSSSPNDNYAIDGLHSDIAATASGVNDAMGIYSGGTLTFTDDISGNITANGGNAAYGIYSLDELSITGDVSGDISATGEEDFTAGIRSAQGLTIDGRLSGEVSALGTGDQWAAGIASYFGDLSITEGISGSVSGNMTGPTASWAIGVYAYHAGINGGDSNTPLDITGSITAEGTADAYAIKQVENGGERTNLKLERTGTISALSSGGGDAYAIWCMNSGDDIIELVAGCTVVGDIVLSGGTDVLTLSGTSHSTTYDGDISGAESLNVTGGTWRLNGVISDAAALHVSGGTLTLTGVNTYTGGTTLSGGTLVVSANNNLGEAADGISFNGGTLRYGAAFGLARDLTLGTNGGTINTNSYDVTISNAIDGTGSLAKTGAGTLTLSGANTYSGGTTISGGTLAASNDANLGNAAGTLSFNGGTLQWNAAFDTARDVTLDAGGGTIASGAHNVELSGTIDGTGSLTKTGTGTLTLSGTNTYSGGTNINGGTLVASGGSAIGDSGTVTIADVAGATLRLDNNETIGSLAGGGTTGGAVNLQGNTLTTSDASSTTFAGIISGTGSLVKQGSGTLTLSGTSTYTGGTTVSAGALSGDTDSLQGNITNNSSVEFQQAVDGTYAGTMIGTGSLAKTGAGTLTLSGANTYSGGTTISGGTLAGNTTSLQGNITNNASVAFNQAVDGTYAGAMIGTGSLVKLGVGTLTLSGANTYTGGTTVSAGRLVGNTTSLQGNITNNASVEFDQAVNGTYAGTMIGTGSLAKTGVGRLTLSGTNTYTGGTTVSEGALRVGANSNLGDSSGTLSLDAGELEYASGFTSARVVTIGAGGGTFDTDGHDAVLSGAIGGAGSLTKTGSGTLTLSGNSTYVGATDVQGGTLILNGTSTSNFTVESGARLGGTGTLGALNNSGTVAPGNSIGTLTTNGNYTQNTSSTLEIEISDSGSSDLLDASGTATINGGTVDVRATNGLYADGATYTFLDTTGGVSGTFDSVTDNLAFFDVTLLYNANDVQLQLHQLPYTTLAETFNQYAVAAYLDGLYPGATGDLAVVMGKLTPLTPTQARAAFDSMSGELYASLPTVGIENADRFLSTIAGRLRAQDLGSAGHYGAVAADTTWRDPNMIVRGNDSGERLACRSCCRRPWAEGYGVGASISGDGNASGLDYSTGGVAFGLERSLDCCTLFGVVGGYSNTYASLDSRLDRSQINSGQAGLYLHRVVGEMGYATGIAAYGHNDYDSRRQIITGDDIRSASADYAGNEFSCYMETGRTLCLRRVRLQPFGGVEYIRLHQDGFTESGAQSVDLATGSVNADSLRGLLGTRLVSYAPTYTGGWISLEGRALWRHEFLDDERVLGAAFAGQPGGAFVVRGVDVDRDAAILGGGVTFCVARGTTFYTNYDLLLSEDYTAHAGSGGLTFVW